MNKAYLYEVPAYWLALSVFLLILIANFLGARYRRQKSRKDPAAASEGLGPVESSLLGLMALILSFTFSLASSKFEARRQIIIQEANDIGTAILRCDMYPDSMRRLFHQDFSDYLESRIAYYDGGDHEETIQAALKCGEVYSHRIWKRAADYSHDPSHLVSTAQMIPALNNMIDIVSTRDAARIAKVPPLILFVLAILTLIASFLLGYGQKGKRNSTLTIGFALMTTIALYLILELDRPRRGLLNLNSAEYKIVELRKMLKD